MTAPLHPSDCQSCSEDSDPCEVHAEDWRYWRARALDAERTVLDTRPADTRRSCWTCRHSGPRRDGCELLTLDEEADAPILAWLETALLTDGTAAEDAHDCPGWAP